MEKLFLYLDMPVRNMCVRQYGWKQFRRLFYSTGISSLGFLQTSVEFKLRKLFEVFSCSQKLNTPQGGCFHCADQRKLYSWWAGLKSEVRFKLVVVTLRTLFVLPNADVTFGPDLSKASCIQIIGGSWLFRDLIIQSFKDLSWKGSYLGHACP